MGVLDDWLHAGKRKVVAGHSLLPVSHPHLDIPLEIVKSQASTYVLEDADGGRWMLKKFLPARTPDEDYVAAIAESLPRLPGFSVGHKRTVLAESHLTALRNQTIFVPGWLGQS